MRENAAPAEIDHDGRAQVGNEEKKWEDGGVDKARAQIHLVRLLIDPHKFVVHILLLPEVFRHGNTTDQLMYTIEHRLSCGFPGRFVSLPKQRFKKLRKNCRKTRISRAYSRSFRYS